MCSRYDAARAAGAPLIPCLEEARDLDLHRFAAHLAGSAEFETLLTNGHECMQGHSAAGRNHKCVAIKSMADAECVLDASGKVVKDEALLRRWPETCTLSLRPAGSSSYETGNATYLFLKCGRVDLRGTWSRECARALRRAVRALWKL